jgi:precorrin-6x reductase
MKKILIFGGTSEEHGLISALANYPVAVTLCVASEYGATLLPQENGKLKIHTGRMDGAKIADFLLDGGFSAVVDATHPYAVEVTRNINRAAVETGTPYLRLLRDSSTLDGVVTVGSVREAAENLKELKGNVLIATGSKELAAYTIVPDYQARLYPRVLPTIESIETCLSNGFPASHIIAMHGPFSKELNIALMKQFKVNTIVTKDGGKPGGFPEKLEAVRELGADIIVIRRPDDEGLTQSEVIERLSELLEGEQCV